jgi:tryptophan synthase beta chain
MTKENQPMEPTREGFYGRFGGAYVPEILYKCVHDLQEAYLPIIESEEFKREYAALLKDYVGRPSTMPAA